MDYVTVGSTGVQVSPLCFGTMSFGSEADEQTSIEMFHRVREAGINFLRHRRRLRRRRVGENPRDAHFRLP